MRTREDYEKAFETVAEVIRQWDPDGLLAGGAPRDEYDREIAKIVTSIPKISCALDATRTISDVFSEMFDPADYAPEKCSATGSLLYTRLVRAGLVL